MSITAINRVPLSDLTEARVSGNGAFDLLMKAAKAHLDEEWNKNRIKGAEYSQVYLGSLTAILDSSVQFLLQKDKYAREADLIEAQIDLIRQQIVNAEVENRVLEATVCKLKAEYDLLLEQRLKTTEETGLLAQKKVTERAQTVEAGVDEGSVVGRQKQLYMAQTNGFTRDAEQKAAKLLVDTWSVRRTTDEGTVADGTNRLDDVTIGRAIAKLLSGVNA